MVYSHIPQTRWPIEVRRIPVMDEVPWAVTKADQEFGAPMASDCLLPQRRVSTNMHRKHKILCFGNALEHINI
jgi:hypothetical protein